MYQGKQHGLALPRVHYTKFLQYYAVAIVLIIAGFFVYRNREAIFGAPPQVQVDDGRLAADIREALSRYDALRDQPIAIRSKNGNVVLSGSVDTDWKIQSAVRVAGEVNGVRRLENDLQVRAAGKASESSKRNGLNESVQKNLIVQPGVAQQMHAHENVQAGYRALEQGDKKSAMAYFRHALNANPNDSEAQAGLAKALSAN